MVDYVHYEEEKGPRLFKVGKFSFSTTEFKHLFLALLLLVFTFMLLEESFVKTWGIVTAIIVFTLVVGSSFIFHEFGHKLVAQHYGFISEFRADFFWMAISLAMALSVFFFGVGFVFIAPGAVMILAHRISVRQNGIISVAGPMVNLVLALIFVTIDFIIAPVSGSLLHAILYLGVYLNAFLGIFNMIPVWILDGRKVIAWNWRVYLFVMSALVILLVYAIAGM